MNQESTLSVGDIGVNALIKVELGYLFAVWVAVLTKQVSGYLFVSIQGEVNAVPGVVSPSSVSHVFLQCLLDLPS